MLPYITKSTEYHRKIGIMIIANSVQKNFVWMIKQIVKTKDTRLRIIIDGFVRIALMISRNDLIGMLRKETNPTEFSGGLSTKPEPP